MTGTGSLTLAIDAATYEGTVAVIRGGVVVAAASVAMRGETEERLMPAVLAAIESAGASVRDVGQVVCGEGPGSFTSLRIAAAIAKGIAVGNGVPLYGVSSLALVVAGADGAPAGRYLAILDAMRGERFVAEFNRGPDGGVTQLGVVRRVGVDAAGTDAAHAGATPIGPLEVVRHGPHARGVAPMLAAIVASGPVVTDSWEPVYGRLAEAQVKWEAAHGRPLGA